MIGVLILTLILDALLTAGIVLCVRIFARGTKVATVVTHPAAIACLFVVLIEPLLRGVWASSVVQGNQVTLQQVRGPGPDLPEDATKITYYADFQGMDAFFSVPEEAFRSWVNANDWHVEQIVAPEEVVLHGLNVRHTVNEGFIVNETFHRRGTGVQIVFDARRHQVYYRYSAY